MSMIDPDLALRLVREAKELAYDVETNGLDWKVNDVCGYSFSDGRVNTYIPTNHSGGGNINNAERFKRDLARAFKARRAPTIGHNIKFDAHFSLNDGVELNAEIYDTMIIQALLNEHTRSFALGSVARLYNVTPKKADKLQNYIASRFGVPPNRECMGLFHKLAGNDPIAVEYAAGDTQTTFEIFQAQKSLIAQQELHQVYSLENKLIWPLVRMERNGIKVETKKIVEKVEALYSELESARLRLEDPIMNVRSSEELKAYFQYYKITDWPITEAGNPSFSKSWLSTTEEGKRIIQVKKLEHFINAFLKPFLKKHIYKGAVYTSFNQLRSDDYGTVSGRLSSNNPNMQQISKRDKYIGELFRSMFVARDGYFLAEADYSQAEPRLYAHYSKEPKLLEGYNATPFIDMHSIVSNLMGIPRDPDAKIINLGILYMMGAAKLARSLNVDIDRARELLNQWYALFPLGKQFRNKCTKVAEQRGFVRTILGRRRRFPNPDFAYKALNAVIQGGSADILKYKIVELDSYIQSLPKGTMRMLLNIHDALVYEVEETETGVKSLRKAIRIIENVAAGPFNLIVPFVAEFKCGKNWGYATYSAKAGSVPQFGRIDEHALGQPS